jgi:hypothetical protein
MKKLDSTNADNLIDEMLNLAKKLNLNATKENVVELLNQSNWYNVSLYQKLSETFIAKFADKVDWNNISSNQILSEKFIEKYTDQVYWKYISQYQKLSEEFIERHM